MTIADLPDGVYFDLPFEEYLALPRLSAIGIKNMLTSPATFWARSWMNPARNDGDTTARQIGRAWHCARLEPHRFATDYARGFDPTEYPDALRTDQEVQNALADLGEKKTTKDDGGSAGRAQRLAENVGFGGQILSLLRAEHEAANAGRKLLSPALYDDIVQGAAHLRQQREVAALLEGGEAEVTILWTMNGVPMKSRLDYLAPAHFADIKTFSNPYDKQIDQCILDAVRYGRYYTQKALYQMAAEEIRICAIGAKNGGDRQHRLIESIRECPHPLRPWLIFCETGGVPNILARELRFRGMHPSLEIAAPDREAAARTEAKYGAPTQLFNKAVAEIEWAQRTYMNCLDLYREGEPWLTAAAIGEIGDEDFSRYWLESDW